MSYVVDTIEVQKLLLKAKRECSVMEKDYKKDYQEFMEKRLKMHHYYAELFNAVGDIMIGNAKNRQLEIDRLLIVEFGVANLD